MPPETDPTEIGIRQTSFTWDDEEKSGETTPRHRNFTLRIDGEIIFKRGRINLITGQTGTGKTSLLMALLGNILCLLSCVNYTDILL